MGKHETAFPSSAWSRDYARIEKALAFIEENIGRKPGLAEGARQVGLSEFHFQRLFRRMVGISPKRYEQFLTARAAKRLLDGQADLLAASYESGLSGPGRLHDLFVSCEAVTPGEYKRGGEGLEIRWGLHPSPFGECLIALTGRGICGLSFVSHGKERQAVEALAAEWPRARLLHDARRADRVARLLFDPAARAVAPAAAPGGRPFSLLLHGTNFQIKVWEALLAIPPGTVSTYEAVARSLGREGSARAVGNAVGANPVAFLIPCHRVIRASGELGGYRWGAERKRLMLAWESASLQGSAGLFYSLTP
jgi:AraC family transcriptional regulator, regulatory protein of adaptative response / methylated-DNA-[protein]-cysteine methyltransferase